MRSICIADVGDGLCLALQTLFDQTVQIDCGGNDGRMAFYGLNSIFSRLSHLDYFVLSHFHGDHYNGLQYMLRNPASNLRFSIKEVYYPLIPKFKRNMEFFRSLMTMNARIFGAETGVREYELIRTIRRLNQISFRHRPLAKGDFVNIHGSSFEVLWPPPVIDDQRTLAVIRRALQDFGAAREEDEETRELYDRIREENLWIYFEGGESKKIRGQDIQNLQFKKKRKLPAIVEKANKSLALAANHMSLVLCEDNRFLFWGDVEGSEIKQIANDLIARDKKDFYVLITPHHGTHWHNSLTKLRCVWSVSSNGKEKHRYQKPFKSISQRSLSTFVNGELRIPVYPTQWEVAASWLGLWS